ncbi:MAG: hypothetical protein AUG51_09360 [Acidobacteria bacterium 13_1_20CM_3_53_8]|nr:MAG: hypothetical protein AUG51_09360 [Acidobacteria bacterium 13_1_20CM_3_53_8]
MSKEEQRCPKCNQPPFTKRRKAGEQLLICGNGHDWPEKQEAKQPHPADRVEGFSSEPIPEWEITRRGYTEHGIIFRINSKSKTVPQELSESTRDGEMMVGVDVAREGGDRTITIRINVDAEQRIREALRDRVAPGIRTRRRATECGNPDCPVC